MHRVIELILAGVTPIIAIAVYSYIDSSIHISISRVLLLAALFLASFMLAKYLIRHFKPSLSGRLQYGLLVNVLMHAIFAPIYFLVFWWSLPPYIPLITFITYICLLIVQRVLYDIEALVDKFINGKKEKPEECVTRLYRTAAEGYKTAWIISYTGVSNEPRVLRQSRALIEAGWRVVVLGFDGHSERPGDWNYIRLPEHDNYNSYQYLYMSFLRKLGRVMFILLPGLSEIGARIHTKGIPCWRNIYQETMSLAKDSNDLNADLVISHDYFTCQLGYDLSRLFGAKFTVDCHEYSSGQYAHDPNWVRYHRPYVVAMQKYYLARADVVTTVCDGIANILNKEQKLKKPVVTIRSVPFLSSQSFHPVGNKIIVLYHGNISYIRGLHKAIKSVALWRPEFQFLIRGSGESEYIDDLQDLIVKTGVQDRVNIEPSVAFNQIIPKANEADIGYFVHKDVSPQKRFALPNKFFEYVMAGLAICVSDLPEMAAITKKYELGVLVDGYDEQVIADAINSFDRDKINKFKEASINAAKELNWNIEKNKMIQTYTSLFDS